MFFTVEPLLQPENLLSCLLRKVSDKLAATVTFLWFPVFLYFLTAFSLIFFEQTEGFVFALHMRFC